MILFWINIEISFDASMPFIDENAQPGDGAKGFFQEIGCTADDEQEAKQMVMAYLKEIEWLHLPKTEVSFPRLATISSDEVGSEIYGDPDIKDSLLQDPLMKGVWYISGKAFFSDELSDDEFYKVKVEKTDKHKGNIP